MHHRSLRPLLLLAAIAAAGCGDSAANAPGAQTVYGDAVTVGAGAARSYIVQDHGQPTEIGIALSEQALTGLPAATGAPMDTYSFLLSLPADNPTGYQVVELNWNPGGHPPPMVYMVPHFDFHFYTQSLAERNAITPADPTFGAKAANFPAEAQRPAGYVPPVTNGQVEAIPMMGVHWANPAAPEFHGTLFTNTFIYGSWNGRITFVEPMVSLAFLLTRPAIEPAIVVPSSVDHDGYRPKAYRIGYDSQAKEYRIGITQLTLVKAN